MLEQDLPVQQQFPQPAWGDIPTTTSQHARLRFSLRGPIRQDDPRDFNTNAAAASTGVSVRNGKMRVCGMGTARRLFTAWGAVTSYSATWNGKMRRIRSIVLSWLWGTRLARMR